MAVSKIQLTAIAVVAILIAVTAASVVYGDDGKKDIGESRYCVTDTFIIDERLNCTIDGKTVKTGDVISFEHDASMYVTPPSRGTIHVTYSYDDQGGMGPGGGFYEELTSSTVKVYLDGVCWYAETLGTITVTFTPNPL